MVNEANNKTCRRYAVLWKEPSPSYYSGGADYETLDGAIKGIEVQRMKHPDGREFRVWDKDENRTVFPA